MSPLEIAANVMTVVCIFLAGRNNVHTWWTGIVACVLFGALFYDSKLYADVTLQLFFVGTSIIGWIGWAKKSHIASDGQFNMVVDEQLPITRASREAMIWMVSIAVAVAIVYGFLLHVFTDAYAPWIDSIVLTFSVIAQLTLMKRNYQTWPLWVIVNLVSVPLYFKRELYLTSGLYAVFLVHAVWAWKNWLNLRDEQFDPKSVPRVANAPIIK